MFETLSPWIILAVIGVYFLVLLSVSFWTSRGADSADFFIAGRKSSWVLVAIGMIGASLSGVTFISIPGKVGAGGLNTGFSYMQVVMGYMLGYLFIGAVLMPMYYRMKLTSIYEYLGERFGFYAYKTGAAYFLLSRVIGASFRLFLVAMVLQAFVLQHWGIPFWVTVLLTIALIWVYTFQGGIKTIVWTDTLQTFCMLGAVVLTIGFIARDLELDLGGLIAVVRNSEYSQMFFFEGGWNDPNNFFKQFLSGALIAVVMTGLDQDMMQKNLSCPNIRDAQKNMFSFSIILVFANLLFLALGALLYIYADYVGITPPANSDQLYPMLALEHLSPWVGVLFILGLVAAAYSSADSALTALTTSFCVDFLGMERREMDEGTRKSTRLRVHIGFSVLLFLVILLFNWISNDAVINQLFVAAGYTYGPLLGLFSFGILSRRQVRNNWVIPVCVAAPVLSFLLNRYSDQLLGGFEFGFLILALNGLLTFLGLWLISYNADEETD